MYIYHANCNVYIFSALPLYVLVSDERLRSLLIAVSVVLGWMVAAMYKSFQQQWNAIECLSVFIFFRFLTFSDEYRLCGKSKNNTKWKRKRTKMWYVLFLVVILLNLQPILCQLIHSFLGLMKTHTHQWVQYHIFQHNTLYWTAQQSMLRWNEKQQLHVNSGKKRVVYFSLAFEKIFRNVFTCL